MGRQWQDVPLKTLKGWEHIPNTENSNESDREGEPPKQPFTGEQATAFQQLLRLQRDIEGQGHRVARAVQPIAEALDRRENVSVEMISHIKAQILRAHLQFDDLEEVLDSLH
jgi:hypothetical protein